MTDINTDQPKHVASDERATFLARSKKAVAGGITGAVAGGGTAFTSAFSDGSLNENDAWLIVGAIVGGFALGFVGVWNAPANAE